MIAFEITNGDKKYLYKYPERASEISLDKLIKYEQEVEAKKPEILKKLEELESEEDRKEYLDSIDPEELERSTISYYLREVQFFTGMKIEHLNLIPVKDPEGYDIFSLRNLIRRPLSEARAEVITSFRFMGTEYLLPASPPNLFDPDSLDYMRGSTIGEYCTASELMRSLKKMKKGSIEGLLHIIAVLCRKKGETLPVYPDEQTNFIQERALLFRGLDYQTALNVGFFLTKQEQNSESGLRSLLRVRALRRALYRVNTDFT